MHPQFDDNPTALSRIQVADYQGPDEDEKPAAGDICRHTPPRQALFGQHYLTNE